jgi:hypothetical protein
MKTLTLKHKIKAQTLNEKPKSNGQKSDLKP